MAMVIGSLVGAGMVSYAIIRGIKDNGQRAMKKVLETVINVCELCTEHSDTEVYAKVTAIKPVDYGYQATIKLPIGLTFSQFSKQIEAFEQATSCAIRLRHISGGLVEVDMGMYKLENHMNYNDKYLFKRKNQSDLKLSIPLYTPFGIYELDFWDEASTHLLIGGATRMGKSVFLRMLFVHLIRITKGNIQFMYINNKIEDFVPLRGVEQISEPAETIKDAITYLQLVQEEIKKRKEKIRRNRDCINVRQYREKYSDDPIPPLFVVIDEYARFADSEEAQNMVMEIAETAGYLDVHLVLATQRPDASTVLKPRIRANLLSRIAFQTVDEVNSNMIVHVPDAAHLGRIQGRAILLDGLSSLVHVPYMSESQAQKLLKPYWKEIKCEEPRYVDIESTETLPRFVTGSDRLTGLS